MGYEKSIEILEKDSDEGLYLFDIEKGNMVQLNPVATLLWKNTEDSFNLDDLKKIINENCELNNLINIEKDLNEFIQICLKRSLIKCKK